MKWLHNILAVWVEEIHNVFFDEGVVVFFIAVPLLYPLLYAYLYNNEQVREVPVVVVDNTNSSTSRDFLRKADATADIKIVGHCADMREAMEMIHRHKAYGLIYIPAEFDKNLVEGRQAVVELYSDMSSVLYYKAVMSACSEVSLAMNKDFKARRLRGATAEQAKVFAYPIEYKYTPLFNTQNGFATFFIPAVLIMIIQQTMVLGVGMMAGDEREKKRKGFIRLCFMDKNPMEILIGKSTAYLFFYIIVTVYLVCMVPNIFHLIHIWQWKDLIAFMLPFLLACVFFSMTLSCLSYDREIFIIMFVFMSIPMLFMSGISWPASDITGLWKYVSWLFPSTFGINGFIRIGSMGALLRDVRPELMALRIQAVVYFVTTWLVYKKTYGESWDLQV